MGELSTRSIEAVRNAVVIAPPPQQHVSARTCAALAILCLGTFPVVLDTTVVNIAIRSIITLVYAALLITGGRLIIKTPGPQNPGVYRTNLKT